MPRISLQRILVGPLPAAEIRHDVLLLVATWLIVCADIAGAGYEFSDLRRDGELAQIKTTMRVSGVLTIDEQPEAAVGLADQRKSVGMAALTTMEFSERLSERGAAEQGRKFDSIRHYHRAAANLDVGGEIVSTELGDENRLIAVRLRAHRQELYSVHGNLTRWELDFLESPATTLDLYGLLPVGEVEVGDHWDPADITVARFLNLDAVSRNQCQCELLSVNDDIAVVKLSGRVVGSAKGMATEIEFSGDYRFDLVWQRINWCHLELKEQRAGGYSEPAFKIEAMVRVRISPLSAKSPPAQTLLDVTGVEGRGNLSLRFADRGHEYTFLHDRRWYVTDDRTKSTILRLVDNEDLIAQCHISRLNDFPAGSQLGLEEYQEDIKRSLGDNFGQFESARQDTREDEYRVLRVSALGTVSDVPVRWVYYHIASSDGHRAAFMVSSEVDKVEVLADSDRLLADSFLFTPSTSTREPSEDDSEPTQVSRSNKTETNPQ